MVDGRYGPVGNDMICSRDMEGDTMMKQILYLPYFPPLNSIKRLVFAYTTIYFRKGVRYAVS